MCGYAVEWLRSCYQGQWRLFKHLPSVITPGRYVRLAAGAPHYPDFHNFGSRTWRANTGEPEPALGEVDAPTTWDTGNAAGLIPHASLLGNAVCIAEGETVAPPVIGLTLVNGFDSRCFKNRQPTAYPVDCAGINLFDRPTLIQFSTWLFQTYTSCAGVAAQLQTYLGPGSVSSFVENNVSVYPGSAIAYNGRLAVAIFPGSQSIGELALQAVQASIGPVNMGQLSTIPLWWNAAMDLSARLTALGVGPLDPVLLIGHSYGAAAAAVLAAVFKLAQPTRDVCLLTEGCPRPGDSRLINALVSVEQVHLQNQSDPVTVAPFHYEQLGPLVLVVPLPLFLAWSRFANLQRTFLLKSDGSLVAGRNTEPDYAELTQIINWAFLGGSFPFLFYHDSDTYRLYLSI